MEEVKVKLGIQLPRPLMVELSSQVAIDHLMGTFLVIMALQLRMTHG